MFGLSKRERLAREVATLRLEKEAADLRAALGVQNSAGTTATYPLSDPQAFEKLFGPASNAVSADRAMTHSAFYRCVFLIAGSIAMLPLLVYRQQADGHRERDTESPAARLIYERPNARMSPSMFWRQNVADMLMNGNGISWIERDRNGTPLNLWPIPWNRVGIRLDNILGEPTQIYVLTLDNGRYITAHQDDVLHFPGSAQWQIFRAMSPLSAYATSVGIGLSADAFAKAYFDNGSAPDGYISVPNQIKSHEDAEAIRKDWMAHHGGANRFAGPAVIPQGGKFEQLKLNAVDAQLLDSRRFSVEDIGRIFGVPPHMLGALDKATSFGKGLEEQTQAFLDFTLGPHLRAIEDELNWKLVRQRTKIAEFDREGFVRGDLKSRMEAIQIMLGGNNGPGLISQNEGRRKINLGPVKKGDQIVSWPAQPSGSPDQGGDGEAPPAKEPAEPKADPAPDAPPSAPKKQAQKRAPRSRKPKATT
ncbi:phage portal protein [Rhodoblastus acidophilus]|uniref:phage portal protein n=1 Tax=Rhodoblastus acidophilus TaxID=1074 RepID=UPI0022252A81|nr:phage portal protein [Rhodoblastus acidophilus]